MHGDVVDQPILAGQLGVASSVRLAGIEMQLAIAADMLGPCRSCPNLDLGATMSVDCGRCRVRRANGSCPSGCDRLALSETDVAGPASHVILFAAVRLPDRSGGWPAAGCRGDLLGNIAGDEVVLLDRILSTEFDGEDPADHYAPMEKGGVEEAVDAAAEKDVQRDSAGSENIAHSWGKWAWHPALVSLRGLGVTAHWACGGMVGESLEACELERGVFGWPVFSEIE